ncbi:MAG TPA: GNAT family N-acetyltransferase [Saprospiraceae bacterium]|nr:GNAT family N-acetyltransferase [Saprospiraceae bacterium]HMQ84380.1 GNAT family N-acetyltransferase [Saprospiraceae bacterium]
MNPFQSLFFEGERTTARTLTAADFETLYGVASDPLIWEQHPNKDRYQRAVFQNFFEGALKSDGALIIFDKISGTPIGSSRYYDFDAANRQVFIGYTFYSRQVWGKGHNPEVKRLMLDYAFQYVDQVFFHVGKDNIRSRMAMERLQAEYVRDIEVAYYGETPKINVEYVIKKDHFMPA